VNLVASFGFSFLVLLTHGASREADLVFASFMIPEFVATVLQGPISNAAVPRLSSRTDDRFFGAEAWTLLAVGLAVGAGLAAALGAVRGPVLSLSLPGFAGPELETLVRLFSIALLQLPFLVGSTVILAACHARGRFLQAELSAVGVALAAVVALLVLGPDASVESFVIVGSCRPLALSDRKSVV